MRLGRLGLVLALVASTWLWMAAPAAIGAGGRPSACRAIDDPEPVSCPLCGGDAALHHRIVLAMASAGGRQAIGVLRLIFG